MVLFTVSSIARAERAISPSRFTASESRSSAMIGAWRTSHPEASRLLGAVKVHYFVLWVFEHCHMPYVTAAGQRMATVVTASQIRTSTKSLDRRTIRHARSFAIADPEINDYTVGILFLTSIYS